MLTKDEKDALFAQMLQPYSAEEFGRFIRPPDCRLRGRIERVHYHNQELCNLVEDWRDYRAGRAPRPSQSLLLALTPAYGGANDARDTLGFIADFYAARPHGAVERWPCLAYMTKTSITLMERLALLHPTPHLADARRHFADFAHLIAYEGEPTLRQDEYATRVQTSVQAFFDDCERNAVAIDTWLHKPPELAAADSEKPLSQRRNDARERARARMASLYASGLTWTEAEDKAQSEMWREFHALGLACAKHNFHLLRYKK